MSSATAVCWPSAHRRKKSDFVSGRQRSAPAGIFLIDGRSDGSAKFGELGKPPAVALEKILDASAVGKLGLLLGDAGDFLELAEKENADAHSPF